MRPSTLTIFFSTLCVVLYTEGRTYSLSNPHADPEPLDLSLDTLVDDFINLIATIYPDPSEAPTFVVCSKFIPWGKMNNRLDLIPCSS